MSISSFYTIFWVLYFPLCIAFYQYIAFDYIDEILTLLLIVFTIGKLENRHNRKAMNEIWTYLFLMTFYVIYSLVIHVTVSDGVWLDLQQQLRPYAVFYTTWLLAPQFTKRQKNIILTVMMLTTIAYLVAFLVGISTIIQFGNESAVLGQLTLITGMTYYLFRPYSRKTILLSIIIVGIGILGGKSKFFGEYISFIALVWFLKGRIHLSSFKSVVQFSLLTAVVLFFTWTKFNAYYIEGMQDDTQKQARPESYKVAVQIMKDYFPFGSGLGSFATNAAAVYYSPLYKKYDMDKIWGLTPENPMFLADAFYPTLAEYGVVGFIFFLLFWKRRYNDILRLIDVRYYKMGIMCILALALESVADTSYLSGKGMGYFMLLGMCVCSYKKIRVRRIDAKP